MWPESFHVETNSSRDWALLNTKKLLRWYSDLKSVFVLASRDHPSGGWAQIKEQKEKSKRGDWKRWYEKKGVKKSSGAALFLVLLCFFSSLSSIFGHHQKFSIASASAEGYFTVHPMGTLETNNPRRLKVPMSQNNCIPLYSRLKQSSEHLALCSQVRTHLKFKAILKWMKFFPNPRLTSKWKTAYWQKVTNQVILDPNKNRGPH